MERLASLTPVTRIINITWDTFQCQPTQAGLPSLLLNEPGQQTEGSLKTVDRNLTTPSFSWKVILFPWLNSVQTFIFSQTSNPEFQTDYFLLEEREREREMPLCIRAGLANWLFHYHWPEVMNSFHSKQTCNLPLMNRSFTCNYFALFLRKCHPEGGKFCKAKLWLSKMGVNLWETLNQWPKPHKYHVEFLNSSKN